MFVTESESEREKSSTYSNISQRCEIVHEFVVFFVVEFIIEFQDDSITFECIVQRIMKCYILEQLKKKLVKLSLFDDQDKK